jgi:PPK2 family polyphosphate:nucleotide phosphotransferase
MRLHKDYRIAPHGKVKLNKISAKATGPYKNQADAQPDTDKNVKKLGELQQVFAADGKHALLIVLQAMDTGGKDGTIRHIFTGVNPQGCDVAQFKVPTPLEASHDFLWRIHQKVPERGKIGIFNRSHYEDVLVTRVHKMIGKKECQRRCDDIVRFEELLAQNGTVILKFFLHISHAEQTARLQARLDDPDKRWKLSEGDFREREFWDQYQKAYEEAMEATSRSHAPWFIVPSDNKWYRNVVISKVLVETLEGMKLAYPKATVDLQKCSLK